MPKVCLIIGAGAGIGMATSRRFAKDGYHICLVRRSDQAGLDKSIHELIESGHQASGFILDVTTPDHLEALVTKIETEIGEIHTAVYNVGAQIGDRNLDSTTHSNQIGKFRVYLTRGYNYTIVTYRYDVNTILV